MRDELVFIENTKINDKVAEVTRSSYERVWKSRGFTIVEDDQDDGKKSVDEVWNNAENKTAVLAPTTAPTGDHYKTPATK